MRGQASRHGTVQTIHTWHNIFRRCSAAVPGTPAERRFSLFLSRRLIDLLAVQHTYSRGEH